MIKKTTFTHWSVISAGASAFWRIVLAANPRLFPAARKNLGLTVVPRSLRLPFEPATCFKCAFIVFFSFFLCRTPARCFGNSYLRASRGDLRYGFSVAVFRGFSHRISAVLRRSILPPFSGGFRPPLSRRPPSHFSGFCFRHSGSIHPPVLPSPSFRVLL